MATSDVGGAVFRRIHRAHAIGPNDGTDVGTIASRTLTFTKARADSDVRITWTDNRRVFRSGPSASACVWTLKFNGADCASPGPLNFNYYSSSSSGTVNAHRAETLIATCSGLAAGSTTVTVDVAWHPSFGGSDCFTGWDNAYWSIEAEEVY